MVPIELLKKLVETIQAQETPPKEEKRGEEGRVDMRAYLDHYNVPVMQEKSYQDGTLYILQTCLFDTSHNAGEVHIYQPGNGPLSYKCKHNSCQGRTWKEARKIISGDNKLTPFMIGGPPPKAAPAKETPVTPPQNINPKFLTPQAAASQAKAAPQIRFVSGTELEALDFPEPVWIIPNILGEGYIILAGRPKLGKSWLALCLAVAVATGGCALGKGELRAVQGEVLYLALEDRLRRIKRRLTQVLCGNAFPENLLIAESWPRLDKGGLEALQDFLKEHDDCRLVVIDTLAKVRPPRQKNSEPYEFDMMVGGALQSLAHQFHVTILVVHHTRKSPADDPLDEVSGTTGITGAADAIMILKRGRGTADGTLSLTGRDIEEQELALKFHGQEGLWELMGGAAEYTLSQERQDILSILRNVGPKTPAQLANILDKKRESIKMVLSRMKDSGLVKANGKGEYETLSI